MTQTIARRLRWRDIGIASVVAFSGIALAPPAAAETPTTGAALDRGSFANPPAQARPKPLWFWPGGAVKDEELCDQIRQMVESGFGGAEVMLVTWGIFPHTSESASYGTPEFREHLAAALRCARERGFTLDLLLGPAWPIATPETTPASGLALTELAYGVQDVDGPTTFSGPAPPPPCANYGGQCEDAHRKLVAVTAAKPINQEESSQGGVRPTLLDQESAIDLTASTDAAGNVSWEVPPGRWFIFGLWRRPTGQTTISPGAFPETAYVPDHFAKPAAEATAKSLEKAMLTPEILALLPKEGGWLHEDSLELIAEGSAVLWTAEFLSEFKKRRGYSPERFLPAVFIPGFGSGYVGGTTPDFEFKADAIGSRLRHDYSRTLTDLYIENHIKPLREWANSHGQSFGAQVAYNMGGLEATRSATAADGPDTETLAAGLNYPLRATDAPESPYTMDFYRTTVAGAHAAGSKHVFLELAAVGNGDYRVFQSELLEMTNQAYAAGITQQKLTAWSYEHAPGAPWPGWWPFSQKWPDTSGKYLYPFNLYAAVVGSGPILARYSDGWNPNFPGYRHLPPLNAYMGRARQVLEAGKPQVDVVIYRGEDQLWSEYQAAARPLKATFDGVGLDRHGYTYEYLDPVTLASAPIGGKPTRLFPNGAAYRAVVVSEDEAMDPDAAEHLLAAARAGVPIVFAGKERPTRSNSLSGGTAADERVKRAVADMLALPNVRQVELETGENGQPDVAYALRELGVQPAVQLPQTKLNGPGAIRAVHRRSSTGDHWFLWNESSQKAVSLAAAFEAQGVPERLDLWNGTIELLARYRRVGDRTVVPVTLGPNETVVISFSNTHKARTHMTSGDADDVTFRGDEIVLRDDKSGQRTVSLSDGTKRVVELPRLPVPVDLTAWKLRVEGAAPSGEEVHEVTLGELTDWQTIPGLENTSGVGLYTTTVDLPADWDGKRAKLRLGEVFGSVSIRVNGKPATQQSIVIGDVDLGGLLRPGPNLIEIELSTTLNNKLVALARSGDPCCERFLYDLNQSGTNELRAMQRYGLVGDVTLVPYAEAALSVPSTPVSCLTRRGFRSAKVTGRGKGLRFSFKRTGNAPVHVDLFQVSQGRRVLRERLIGRFTGRKAITWNGAKRTQWKATDGYFFARFRTKSAAGFTEYKRVPLRRKNGRWTKQRQFFGTEGCTLLRQFKLSRMVFGGSNGTKLGVSYLLSRRAPVKITVSKGKKVVATFSSKRSIAKKIVHKTVKNRALARGLYRVSIVAGKGKSARRATLYSRKL